MQKKTFEIGEPILQWFGEIVIDSREELPLRRIFDTEYSTSDCINESYLTPGCIIQDGFPNVIYHHVRGINGHTNDMIYFAGVSLRPGDIFSWDYGASHKVKFGPHVELHWNDICNFLIEMENSSQGLTDEARLSSVLIRTNMTLLQIKKENSLPNHPLREPNWSQKLIFNRFEYLSNTPTTMLLVIVSGITHRKGFLSACSRVSKILGVEKNVYHLRRKATNDYQAALDKFAEALDKTESSNLCLKGEYFEVAKQLTETQSLPEITNWMVSTTEKLASKLLCIEAS